MLQGKYEQQQAIRPRLADFEAMVEQDGEKRGSVCPLECYCRMPFRNTPMAPGRYNPRPQNLPQLITEIETSFPALKPHLRDSDGKVRRFINFYVNEEDIRFLGNEKYAFKDGDEVLVIPSIAGGSL